MQSLYHPVFLFFVALTWRTSFSEPFHKGDGKDHPIHVQYHRDKIANQEAEIILDTDGLERRSEFFGENSGHKPDSFARSEKLSTDDATPQQKSGKQISLAESTKSTNEIDQKTSTKTMLNQVTIQTNQGTSTATVSSVIEDPTTEVPVESSSTTLGSTKPTSTTPSPITTTTTTLPDNLYCLCDIHESVCDMNCCCDNDCKKQDRKFFTHCVDQIGVRDDRSSPRRQRSCYKSFVTFKHYTTENGVLNDNGMLCIVRDNSKVDNILPTSKLSEIQKRISDGEINIQPKYSIDSSKKVQYKQEAYKFGSPIVGVKVMDLTKNKVDLVPYGLPTTYHSAPCTEIKEPVKFLENFHSECQLVITNLTHDCTRLGALDANLFINQIQILTNPGDSSDREFILITPTKVCNGQLCTTELNPDEHSEFPKPIYNPGKRVCQNVLIGLNVTFYFGLEGISDIQASAQLQDLQISDKQLTQEFRSNFLWNAELNNTEATPDSASSNGPDRNFWPRSGNPGYIVGKPVIMGKKVTIVKEKMKPSGNFTTQTPSLEDEENKEVEMVKVSKDPAKWMTIHNPGRCPQNPDEASRKSVLFDYSHLTMCILNLTEFKYCEDLQLQVAKILLGSNDPGNFEKLKWHVAAFGNSNPNVSSEWVPVSVKNFPLGFMSTPGNSKALVSKGCDSIVSTLHITVTYAFVGTVDFPQAKITGVLYEPGDSVSFPPEDMSKSFDVSTTVSFRDVTAAPVMRVAKWPVLSITLPKDFFYPFSR
ncbi:tectonic-3-like [Folsomia candida]|uniref:tectonic-3-like n=1 Tax=Folsomia candida TaxID=158441 RepID=UPI001605345B|nr:tectonic-3-like [Folsomia candida]